MKVYFTCDRNQRKNIKGLIGLVFVTALRCKNIGVVCFQRKAFDWCMVAHHYHSILHHEM